MLPMTDFAVSPTCRARVATVPRHDAAARRISPSEANARFRSVVLPHLDDAYALARWLTGSRPDSEDVVQDACLRALRGIGNFSNGNARAWVLTIVRHTTYSWLQKNRPAAVVLEAYESVGGTQDVELGAETPETALIARDDLTLLHAAIAALPIPLRETLLLRELQELSYQEVAEVTEVPIGTVMSRLARARGRITSIMTSGGSRGN
jgi:RNA polymerase sigma factor (sigma-70 family)